MTKVVFRLSTTIAARLTESESIKFSKLVKNLDTTKSELIRHLIIDRLSVKEKKHILKTNK